MANTPSTVPVGQGYTPAQWEAWFQGFTSANPRMPRYTGTNPSARGKTWDQVYPVLYAAGQKQNPKLTPDQVAQAEIELAQIQAVADGIGSTVQYTGTFANDSGKAGAATGAWLGHFSSVLDFLNALGSANLWIRVAKVIGGGVILVVGLLKLTGADQHAGGIARKAVTVAPLL